MNESQPQAATAAPGWPITIGHLTLVDMKAAHLVILQKIDSPFLRHMRELIRVHQARANGKPAEVVPTPYEDEDICEMLYILTRDGVELRAALAQGRERFRETALAETLDQLPFGSESKIIASIATALQRAADSRQA